ncbi:MAG TPA: hypothetical protein VD866_21015 [Urbifossiella sp.]|nr:hypothetical protein [Urbifossiella sp.]
MPANALTPARLKQAREVDDLLKALSSELDTAQNPNRLGLRALKVDAVGFVKTPYHADAFKIWADVHRRAPNDLEARHHLAIMHHARAIDLESKDPDAADADWDAALRHWHALWSADAFWDAIAERAYKTDKPSVKQEAAKKLRDAVPVRLLLIHLDIALHPETLRDRFPRAKFHLKAALGSAFPAEAKDGARKAAYDRFVQSLPEEVWNPDTLDPDKIKIGTDRISQYLDLDPDSPFALADLLRLQVRLARSWFGEFNALGEEDHDARNAHLDRFKRAAGTWRPYLDRLGPLVDRLDEVNRGDARQKLCLWYRVMGDVHRARSNYESAAELFEQGARSATAEEEDYHRCVKGAGEVMGLLARERAVAKATNAKAYADKVRARRDLSLRAVRFLAEAYALLGELDTARAVCEAGIQADEYDGTDLDAMQEYQKNLEDLRTMLARVEDAQRQREVGGRIDKAKEYLEKDQYAEALVELDAAAAVAPDEAMVLFYRCQCHVALLNARDARRDIDRFTRVAEEGGAREAAAQLGTQVAELEADLVRFGPAAMRLRREATDEYKRNNYSRAADLARKAVAASPAAGKPALQQELRIVLASWAAQQVNAAMDSDKVPLAGKETAVRAGIALLEEAVAAVPTDANTRKNLEALRSLVGKLEQARQGEARQAALVAEYGGEKAMELQQKGVGAFNAGKLDEAVSLLRQALEASRRRPAPPAGPLGAFVRAAPLPFRAPDVFGAPTFASAAPGGSTKLKEELAQALVAAAVTKVNTATSPSAREVALTLARLMLQEAVALDPSNDQAAENLRILDAGV